METRDKMDKFCKLVTDLKEKTMALERMANSLMLELYFYVDVYDQHENTTNAINAMIEEDTNNLGGE